MSARPSRGDSVRLEMTKWGDQPHWEMDAVYLGSSPPSSLTKLNDQLNDLFKVVG